MTPPLRVTGLRWTSGTKSQRGQRPRTNKRLLGSTSSWSGAQQPWLLLKPEPRPATSVLHGPREPLVTQWLTRLRRRPR